MRWALLGLAGAFFLGCGDEAAAPPTGTSSASGGSGGATSAGGGGLGGAATTSAGGAGGMGGAGGSLMVPLDGFGVISGDCGELDPRELVAASPGFKIDNELDLMMLAFDESALSLGGKKLFDDPNLGGSSKYSEIFAYEMLYRCELATLLKTEAEIVYDTEGKKTDFLVEVDGKKTGVSVTRAYNPQLPSYDVSAALALLDEKLSDILESTVNVAPADAWDKQILAIMAYAPEHVSSLASAYPMVDPAVRADTIVIVTLTSGDDQYLYSNP